MSTPEVTILCATRNGRDVVRLTLSSLRRFTPEIYRILIADNGSTDGTLEYLSGLEWIHLFRRDRRRRRTSHGATLDWLAQKVETRYFLTLDSDVVFLRHGWLSELCKTLRVRKLAAVGEFERGVAGYRPQLAPHVLLLDTKRFHALGSSFKSSVRIHDPAEARRWHRRPNSEYLSEAELRSYRSAAFYSTGAVLFERMVETGARWALTPSRTRQKYHHLGHMSWGAGEAPVAKAHREKLNLVSMFLRHYEL